MKLISVILVLVQFICLGVLFLTGPVLVSIAFLPFEIFSILLALWGIWEMRKSRLNVFPEVLQGADLVKSGPYKFIRHPMYTALLLFAASLIVDTFSWIRFGAGLLLLTDLVLKIEWEERLLRKQFAGYAEYAKRTYKIIPWIY